MQAAVKARSTVKAKITRVNTFLENAQSNPVSTTALEIRLEMLKDCWKDYEATQSAVEGLTLDIDMEAQDKEREKQEDKYATIVSGIKSLIVQQQPISQAQGNFNSMSSQNHPTDHFIPKFEMPSFYGNFSDWPNFKNVFNTMVHEKQTLRNHQKLHILKLALQGEAARLLQSTIVTDENYEDSWKCVVKRYDHQRQLLLAQTHTLLRLPYMKAESAKELQNLLDTMQGALRSIKAMEIPTDNWDPLLVSILIERLDADTRRNWELQLKTTEMPKFTEVEEFVEQRCQALEIYQTASKDKVRAENHFTQPKNTSSFHTSTRQTLCILCDDNHPLFKCSAFHSLSIPERMEKVKENALCFNCLRRGHGAKDCNSGDCRQCNEKHHTLLHFQKPPPPTPSAVTYSVGSHHATGDLSFGTVLLATAIIKVRDCAGNFQLVRALLDSASEASFVTKTLIRRLGLKSKCSRVQVSGLGQIATTFADGVICLQISSCSNPEFQTSVNAMILPKVTGKLPRAPVNLTDNLVKSLTLADHTYSTPAEVDLLLGADCFGELCSGTILHGEEGVHALNTVFGWVLTGKHKPRVQSSIRVHHATVGRKSQFGKIDEFENLLTVFNGSTKDKPGSQQFKSISTAVGDSESGLLPLLKEKGPVLIYSGSVSTPQSGVSRLCLPYLHDNNSTQSIKSPVVFDVPVPFATNWLKLKGSNSTSINEQPEIYLQTIQSVPNTNLDLFIVMCAYLLWSHYQRVDLSTRKRLSLSRSLDDDGKHYHISNLRQVTNERQNFPNFSRRCCLLFSRLLALQYWKRETLLWAKL